MTISSSDGEIKGKLGIPDPEMIPLAVHLVCLTFHYEKCLKIVYMLLDMVITMH